MPGLFASNSTSELLGDVASLPLLLQEPLICLETALPCLLGQYQYLGREESEDYSYEA